MTIFSRSLFQKLQDELSQKAYRENFSKLLDEVAEWVAHTFLFDTKFQHVNNFEPWDSSGDVRKTSQRFNINDYPTFQDFLEEELTGERIPTFASGHGWHFPTFSEKLRDDIIWDYVVEQQKLAIGELIRSKDAELIMWIESNVVDSSLSPKDFEKDVDYWKAEKVMEIILDVDPHIEEGVESVLLEIDTPYSDRLYEMMTEYSLEYLYNKAEAKVLAKHYLNEQIKKEKIKEDERKNCIANALFAKIIYEYYVQYNEKLPGKIDHRFYQERFKNFLRNFVKKHNLSNEDVKILCDYLQRFCSNLVSTRLKEFEK